MIVKLDWDLIFAKCCQDTYKGILRHRSHNIEETKQSSDISSISVLSEKGLEDILKPSIYVLATEECQISPGMLLRIGSLE